MKNRCTLALLAVLGLAACKTNVVTADRAPGGTFRDCAECPEMVVLAPASFTMGSEFLIGEIPFEMLPPQSFMARSDRGGEHPAHQVAIRKPIAVGKFEVTLAQYRTFVEAGALPSGPRCTVGMIGPMRKKGATKWGKPHRR